GVLSYGQRPTVAKVGVPAVLEVHLFEYSGDLYGEEVDVYFHAWIREEAIFNSLEALGERIRRDCDEARVLLRSKNTKDCLYIHALNVHSAR
ncbi:MAG: riboflavin kinase, partial [Verrucomicrobia bacterium]|nr:riboflavin kinase [Verrucomicrobiota bacterium]